MYKHVAKLGLFWGAWDVEKVVKKQVSWTNNLITGKGLTRTGLNPFLACAKAQNTVNYSVFTTFDLEKEHVAALPKLRKYRRFLGRGARNVEHLAFFENTS